METQHQRSSDREIGELAQRLSDFIKSHEAEKEQSVLWREGIKQDLEEVKSSVRPLILPYKVAVWVSTITGIGLITAATAKLVDHIKVALR